MRVTSSIAELRQTLAPMREQRQRIGCVPTMGALHAGHLSLIDAARRQCDIVVTTIFVNPTQFAPGEDLAQYPRPLEDDVARCRDAAVDIVFTPDVEAIYPEGFETYVTLENISTRLEGAHRPDHFRGVATIVLKLFNIVQPDSAFFGQKDYQQQALIRRMVRDLDLPIEIVTCPTVRDDDGLALSSRNVYLSVDERKSALSLSRCLALAQEMIRQGATDLGQVRSAMRDLLDAEADVVVDYVTVVDQESLQEIDQPQERMVALVAARVGTTRLIDNLIIEQN